MPSESASGQSANEFVNVHSLILRLPVLPYFMPRREIGHKRQFGKVLKKGARL